MAAISKKDKLIEDAQKFAGRGQFDKAASAYEQILASEPGAISLRQKLSEMLIKCGRNDDSRKELEIIGRHYSNNGFYMKAIAVYKQLQKLFSDDISISLTLAELNEKHGLVANSLSEYKLVYEFYNKNDKISESLDILNRMKNVDPQNIPIKIKLAEAYFKHGKKNDSYAVFTSTISTLLERNDNAALAKACARIRQLFPDKPDFMLEVISDQINQGNAAVTINSLQGLLRSNPNRKELWDLIILAYQRLDQPQRVKVAFQHYLKFFPKEPAAMLGSISSMTDEQNLAGALDLLNNYESTLISAGFLLQLEQIYRSLKKISPINTRILQGLIKVAKASGNESETLSLESELQSQQSLSGAEPDSPSDVFDGQPLDDDEITDSPFYSDDLSVQTPASDSEAPGATSLPEEVSTTGRSIVADELLPQAEEEIEV